MPYRMVMNKKIKAEGVLLLGSKLCFTSSMCWLVFFPSFGRREQVFLALRTLLEQLDM